MYIMDTSEKDFESQIEAYLTKNGYIKRTNENFKAKTALDKEILFEFLETTQPKTWEKLKKQHGNQIKEKFLNRLIKEIENRGTLDILRKGVKDLGCKFDLAFFKPIDTLNPEHQQLYNQNKLTIMRQVYFEEKADNEAKESQPESIDQADNQSKERQNKSIDTVIFLNGLPIFTIELKNPLKDKTVENAIWQYRHTRNPKEPLLKFGRCLAHFAVDTDLIYMTTCLTGEETNFLPFNQGNNQSAGNPNNPNNPKGFKTAYLWEQILQKDSLLNILDNFVQMRDILDDKGKKTGKQEIIFPRYHQLDAVRKLVADCLTHGTGKSYLIQHSAGSGKSETIAWLALHLASLKNDQNQRVFNSILVITDRKNLDQQLQNTIKGFNHVPGTITTIKDNNKQSKSAQLTKTLENGDDIIISTLQTFRFALDKITSLKGSHFAVIIDEAHSSESGESKEAVKRILSFNNLETAEQTDNNQPDPEDEINQVVANNQQLKGRVSHVSYFAFTATPKPKTLETFGVPSEQPDGKTEFIPFSLYSMRQAIEEKFILDVLQNYTTFKTYFKLVKAIAEDPKYNKTKAAKKIKDYADLHSHAIRSKIKIIVDHFHNQVADQINGQAKAMIVTRSRLHAVRYKLEIDR